MGSNKIFLSIVIPIRNEESYIGECLDSLLSQDYPKELYEIIVADGMSDDGSRAIVLEHAEKNGNIKLVQNKDQTTPMGLNAAVKAASGDVINYLVSHSYVPENYISQVVEHLGKTDADCIAPSVIAVGKTFKASAIALAMRSKFGVGNSPCRIARESGYVDTGWFGTYRKEVFDKIGYYDSTLIRNQDYEFNRRLINSGGKIFLVSHIKAYYYSRDTLWKLFKQYFGYGYWKLDVFKKLSGAFLLRFQIPVLFVLSLVVLGISGFFSKTMFILFLSLLLVYVLALLGSSFLVCFRERDLRYFPVLPLAFMALHFGFGLGFGYSILKYGIGKLKNILRSGE